MSTRTKSQKYKKSNRWIDKIFDEGISVNFSKDKYSDRDLRVIEDFLNRIHVAIIQLECAVMTKHAEMEKEAWVENYIGKSE
ncbi:MAG TPA: hypothetical protein VJN02_01930 [Gammaproteobacteria bacterium]|nr:hypothetical protein [Gammaproteobacteria bacterium]